MSYAQDKSSAILYYNENEGSPSATLKKVSWLEGHWRGEAFGGITEEIWSPPLGGSMMCAFKLVINDIVKFYEIVTIAELDGSLILRLKHFHNDLKGWEDKNETIDFKLVKITDNTIYFDGLSIQRISDDEMDIYVIIQNGDKQEEVKFNYRRVI